MAPLGRILFGRDFNPGLPSEQYSSQWTHPRDVFSVLLILGGDVVGRAVAQVAGNGISSVTFSFGWVAYSITALVAAIGENKLMPQPDCVCKVINGKSGYVRDNSSWIIGRMVRDFDSWAHPDIWQRKRDLIESSWKFQQTHSEAKEPGSGKLVPKPRQAGLCVSIYEALPAKPGHPPPDFVHYSGYFVAVIQLGIAAIPCGVFGDWGILLITAAGILLAFTSGSMPQFAKEKWACRRNANKTVILTKGNGSQHAIVIISKGQGLDLEDLAAGPMNIDVAAHWQTRVITVVLGVLWIMLLITAAATQENTWFLLAVGGVGILQNIFVAGRGRKPEAFGVPLKFVEVFGEVKVMKTLLEVEANYPKVGRSMLDMYFPGGKLREGEEAEWKALEAKHHKL